MLAGAICSNQRLKSPHQLRRHCQAETLFPVSSYVYALLSSNFIDCPYDRFYIRLLNWNTVRAIPFNDRTRFGIVILVEHPSMQVQTLIIQAMHVNRRYAQHVRAVALVVEALANGTSCNTSRAFGQIAKGDQWTPPGEKHRKLVVRVCHAILLHMYLLVIQQARSQFRALAESHKSYPRSGTFVFVLRRLDAVHHLFYRTLIIDLGMLRQPSKPPSERPKVLIDGYNARAGIAEERAIGEDEPKIRQSFDQGSSLQAEDLTGDTAAM